MKAKRIVFKVGTSSLTNPDGSLSKQKVKVITSSWLSYTNRVMSWSWSHQGAVAAGFGALGF